MKICAILRSEMEMKKTDGICKGNIYGTYVHGVFDADGITQRSWKHWQQKEFPWSSNTAVIRNLRKRSMINLLIHRGILDIDAVYQMMNGTVNYLTEEICLLLNTGNCPIINDSRNK